MREGRKYAKYIKQHLYHNFYRLCCKISVPGDLASASGCVSPTGFIAFTARAVASFFSCEFLPIMLKTQNKSLNWVSRTKGNASSYDQSLEAKRTRDNSHSFRHKNAHKIASYIHQL
jgi:hypothetical protein